MQMNKVILLYNGDCTVLLDDIINKLDKEKIIIVSDPPFNINYHYNSYKDKLSEADYYNLIYKVFNNKKSVIIHYPECLYKISQKINIIPEKIISWVYNSNTAKQHRDIAFFNIKPDMNQVRQPYKNPNDKRIKERIKNGSRGGDYTTGGT